MTFDDIPYKMARLLAAGLPVSEDEETTMDRDWPVPMDELRAASTEALLAPLKARADAIMAEVQAELAAEGLALVNAAEIWAKIEEYRESVEDIAMALDGPWPEAERGRIAMPRIANEIRAMLGLDPLP